MYDLEHFYSQQALAYALPRQGHDDLVSVLAELINARRIVELGTGPGWATRALAGVARRTGGTLWSVDIVDAPGREGLKDDPNVHFVTADSVAWAADWSGLVDLVYCDSDHSYPHVLNELRAWSRHLPRMILVDDTLAPNTPHGSPLEAVVDFCVESPAWRWWNIPVHTGLVILLPDRGLQ